MARDVRDTARQALFTRRAAIASVGAAGLFGAVFWRLYSLQVENVEEFTELAEENRINRRLIVPQRGRILDRFGVELGANRQNFRVLFVPEQAQIKGVSDIEEALDLLGEIVEISDYRRRRVMREVSRNRAFIPVTVKENLEWDEFARVNLNLPDLPGIEPDVGQTRFYPNGNHIAHVVGHVGRVTEEEQRADSDPLLRVPDFRIGKLGVERELEAELRGEAGVQNIIVNAVGRPFGEEVVTESRPGNDVVLSIDDDLQEFTAAQFEGESGAAAVVDVATGDILALVSEPGFDPNLFTFGISPEEWDALRENELNPMVNKAVAGQYPPGSTFKMVVALAALEAGVMRPSEQIFCGGHITLGDRDFHCWRRQGHGAMNMRNGIKHSCDVYFYETARRVGIDRISAMAERLGLGQATDIRLPGERSGLVPTRGWKLATTGVSWQQGETLIAGIGQGFLLATPLQLAVMTARLATGQNVSPRLVRTVGADVEDSARVNQVLWPSLDIDPAHLALVHEGMNAVVNEPGGTATRSAVRGRGMSMAGKTGTAQVRNITAAERLTGVLDNDELPWRLRDHALFVGFGPVEAPRYAVGVVVEHGGSGSRAAGPRAREIMQYALTRDPANMRAMGDQASAPLEGEGNDG